MHDFTSLGHTFPTKLTQCNNVFDVTVWARGLIEPSAFIFMHVHATSCPLDIWDLFPTLSTPNEFFTLNF
jgi:hypothetical protein